MNPNSCENLQSLMSELTDDGLPFPEALSRHLASCPECSAFARLCGEPSSLHAPLPGPGEDLRRNILGLASKPSPARRFRFLLPSAAAAVLALGLGLRWSARPHPERNIPSAEISPSPLLPSPTPQAEIAALRQDLDRAISQLVPPLVVFNSLPER